MVDVLEMIWSETIDINKNTKPEYGTYADLFKRGMLSESDYLSLIGSNKYSSSNAMGSVTMTKSGYGDTRYVSYAGLTVVLPGVSNWEQFKADMAKDADGVLGY